MTKSTLWIDLTIDHAEKIRDFYVDVIGWEAVHINMGDYEDYMMNEHGEPRAGICHARGVNAGLPPFWIPYFKVESLEHSLASCISNGGEILTPVKSLAANKSYAVIRDPSGAVCAIWTEH